MAGELVWTTSATCDGCGKQLKGKFQTCSNCKSVDLCPQCSPRRKTIHAEHDEWHRGAVHHQRQCRLGEAKCGFRHAFFTRQSGLGCEGEVEFTSQESSDRAP
eukprot:15427782-Alexandrium_andersonii.AAC.1